MRAGGERSDRVAQYAGPFLVPFLRVVTTGTMDEHTGLVHMYERMDERPLRREDEGERKKDAEECTAHEDEV